jgi:hypothetical protein
MTSARFSQLAVGLTGGLSDKRRLIWSWQVMKIGKEGARRGSAEGTRTTETSS